MTQAGDLSWFSETLLAQVKKKDLPFNLTGEGEIFSILHPALIKCQHTFEHTPTELTLRSSSHGWNLSYQAPSNVKEFGGFPFQTYEFLKSGQDGKINFGHLGDVTLTKNEVQLPATPELKHYLLPLWLDYALSAELWGPAGKWTRFHERLHTLFTSNGLMVGQDLPGYYPLKKEAHWLENHGFRGKLTQTQFDLILPWDFPLSGLVELEKSLARGP